MKHRFLAMFTAITLAASCFPVVTLAAGEEMKPSGGTETLIYVSPEGADNTGDGSQSNPFASITRARDEVRKLNDDMTGDIRVIIEDGTYVIDDTIEFTAEDSATNDYRISYETADGASPVISGGKAITGWTLHDDEKNIYKATVPEGMNFRQLYVNGEKVTRARNTEAGVGESAFKKVAGHNSMRDGKYLNGKEVAGAERENVLYIRPNEIPSTMNLSDLAGAELHSVISWSSNVMHIKSAGYETIPDGYDDSYEQYIKLYFEDEETELMWNRPFPWVGNMWCNDSGRYPYYLDNAYALMDQPGEWYLDRDTDTLYYKAAADADMSEATVIAPAVETLLDVQGELGSRIEGLSFTGLTFQHSNWTYPSDNGFIDSQDGHPVVSSTLDNQVGIIRPSAAVHVACTNDFRFENNTLTDIGNMTALDLEYGTSRSVVKNNIITEVAGNGIMIAKFTQNPGDECHIAYNPSDSREYCDGDKILNNRITYTGMEFEGTCGIVAGYPRNLTIANNEVGHVPYTGISVGYGWTNLDNAMRGNVIARNEIHNYMERANDGAAIYTLSKQPDSLMYENYMHDAIGNSYLQAWAAGAIYTDEQTNGYTIFRNVSEQGGHANNTHLTGNLVMFDNFLNIGTSLDAVTQEIADAAGPQEYLNSTDEILPLEPIVSGLRVTGAAVMLEGVFCFEESELEVVFCGENSQEIVVKQFLDQTANTIQCMIPENAVAGPVYVRAGAYESNKDIQLATSFEEKLAVDDTFDGDTLDDAWKEYGSTYAPQIDKGTVKVTTNNSNHGIQTADNISISKMQFDFCFNDAQTSFEGIYLYSNGGADSKAGDELSICPAFGQETVRLIRDGNSGTKQAANVTMTEDTWYTCVLMYENGQTKMKTWPADEREPDQWTLSRDGVGSTNAASVQLIYYAGTEKSVSFDNVKIWSNDTPVLEIPTFQEVENSWTATVAGKAPVLPETAKAIYSDGSAIWLKVAWELVDASTYAEPGTFTVKGNVAVINQTVTCEITVYPVTVKDDFETLEEGPVPTDNALWSSNSQAAVETDTENNVVRISSNGSNGTLTTKAKYPVQSFQFDFFLEDDMESYEGLYVTLYRGDEKNTQERFIINPGYGDGQQIRVNYKDNTTSADQGQVGCSKEISSNGWYHAQFAYENGKLCGKVWAVGTDEPSTWDVARATEPGIGNIEIAFYAMSQKYVQIDNVIISMGEENQEGSGSGSGSTATSYTITVQQSDGGKINPSTTSVRKGSDKTFTITADEGYQIADVLVDGKSVGAVSTYTFKNVMAKHTISAKFEKDIFDFHRPQTNTKVEDVTNVGSFLDVKSTDWFAEAVQYAVDNGLMNGTSSNTFTPNGATTRGMIVTILYRQAGSPAVESDGNTWWSDARVWAMANGISDGTNMDKEITREQLATMLWRYAELSGEDVSATTSLDRFEDGDKVSDYAVEALQWAVAEGIVSGKTGGIIDPQAGATRAETATMLMRFCKL